MSDRGGSKDRENGRSYRQQIIVTNEEPVRGHGDLSDGMRIEKNDYGGVPATQQGQCREFRHYATTGRTDGEETRKRI